MPYALHVSDDVARSGSTPTSALVHTVFLAYTDAGQLETVSYPGSVLEEMVYDAEGGVATRTVGTMTSSTSWDQPELPDTSPPALPPNTAG